MAQPTTRCKFRCTSITLQGKGRAPCVIELSAVYPDKEVDGYEHGEDHAFFNATPYGKLTMNIQNAAGAELFQPGDSYYLDITKAPEGGVAQPHIS